MKPKAKKPELTKTRKTGDKKYVVQSALKRDILKVFNVKHHVEFIGKSFIKFRNGEYWGGFLPKEYPAALPLGFLSSFIRSDLPVDIGIYLNRYQDGYALAYLQRNLTVLKGELYYYEHIGAVGSEKYAKLQREAQLTEELRDLIVAKETHLYDVTFTVGAKGSNYQQYRDNHKKVEILFRGLNFRLFRGFYRMWDIFHTVLPFAKRDIPYYQPMTLHSESATAFFPFTSGVFSTFGPNAYLFGFNEKNKTPIFIDRFLYPSYNMLVFGQTGSGKSYFSKLSLVRSRIANPDIMLFSIDPLGEYGELFEAMGGLNIKLWNPGGEGVIINPLDPAMGETQHERVKNFISLLTTLFELNREEKVFLDGVVHKTLRKMGDSEEPVIGDVIETMEESIEIIRRTEGEGAAMRFEGLRSAMEIFESGSLSFLNQPSTINIEGYDYVNFDLSGTPEDFLPFFMFFITNYVYSHIKSNKHEERYKIFQIDEVHHIWKFTECAERLDWLARHTRHYKTSMVLITQSANDGFNNEHTRAILENAYIHLLMHHKSLSDEVRDFYSLSPEQESQVTSAHGGKGYGYSTGLLVVGPMKFPLKIVASEEEDKYLITG